MADEKKVRSFEDLIAEEGLLPLERTVDLVTQIESAINVAEAAGVVINCFEPRAILVVDEVGASGVGTVRTKVLGFARAGDLPVRPGGARASYFAPEQHPQVREGAAELIPTPAALQFSLAAITYEMLAGCPAFPEEIGDAFAAETRARAWPRAAPPPVSEQVMGVSNGLDQVLRRALSTHPSQRYDRIEDFVSALREVSDPAVWDDGATVIWSPAAGDMEPAAPDALRAPSPLAPAQTASASAKSRTERLGVAARRVRSSAGALVDRYRDHPREAPPRGAGPASQPPMPNMGGGLAAGAARSMAFSGFPVTAMPSRRTQMSFLAAAVALVLVAVGVMSGSRVKAPVDNPPAESAVALPEQIRPRPHVEPPVAIPPAPARLASSAPVTIASAAPAPRQTARPARAHSRRGGAHRTGTARR